MKPAPENFPRLSPSLTYQDAAKAIDWLCDAFGFELRLKVEGEPGQILHSELTYGDGVIMVSQELSESPIASGSCGCAAPNRSAAPAHRPSCST